MADKKLTPDQEQEIIEKVIGDKTSSKLETPVAVKKITNVLQDDTKNFYESYTEIKSIIDALGLEPIELEDMKERVSYIIFNALKANKSNIEALHSKVKKELDDKITELEDDLTYKSEQATAKTTYLADKAAAITPAALSAANVKYHNTLQTLKRNYVTDIIKMDPTYGPKKKLLPKLENLLNHIKNPQPHIKNIVDYVEIYRPPRTLRIKNVSDFKTPSDIEKAKSKWDAVVDIHGLPPTTPLPTTLYWKLSPGETTPTALTTGAGLEEEKYKEFVTFMEKIDTFEIDIKTKLSSVSIDPSSTDLKKEYDDNATNILNSIISPTTGTLPDNEQALLFYYLKTTNRPDAHQKIVHILRMQTDAKVPGKQRIYAEELDDDGNPKTESIGEFLSRHMGGFGEKIISEASEILDSLHKKFSSLTPDFNTFRDIIIEVLKTRGLKELTVNSISINKDEAKNIHSSILLSLHPDMREKDILAVLIAFKNHPPYVFDLDDSPLGSNLGLKKTDYILHDFAINASVYSKVKEFLKIDTSKLHSFLENVVPHFKTIRGIIDTKISLGEDPKITDFSSVTGFTEEYLNLFKELMKFPGWADKIGPSLVYSSYLNDKNISIPLITEIQGPETKEINIIFVDVEEKLHRIAGRLADERLDQELKEIGPQGWKQLWRLDKIASKWWKRNAMEGYREKYINEFITRLKEDPTYRTELMGLDRDEVKPTSKLNADIPEEGHRENINADLDAIAEKFGIAWETGDTESYLTENERNIQDILSVEIQQDIRDLCKNFADDKIDEHEFKKIVRKTIIPKIQSLQDPPDSAIVAFLEETAGTKADIDKLGLLDKMKAHKAGLIALDLDNMKINIRLGKAMNVDAKTQIKNLDWFDRASRSLVEGAQRNRFLGRFISPSTMAVIGYGLGNITAQFVTNHTVRTATLLTLGLAAPTMMPAMAGIASAALIGGVFSGMRQRKEILGLKAMKERREALGYRPADDTKGLRMSKIERAMESRGTLYEKVSAQNLINNIETAPDYNSRINALAEAIARNEISEMGINATNNERIDLIKFTTSDGETTVEKQRLELLKAIAKGKIDARNMAKSTTPPSDMEEDLDIEISKQRKVILDQIKTRETAFNRLKRWETLKAAGTGAAMAGAFAGVMTYLTYGSGMFKTKSTETINLTPSGPLDRAGLENSLLSHGISRSDTTRIMGMLKFDANGKLDPSVIQQIKDQYKIDISGIVSPSTINMVPVSLNGGMHMDKNELIRAIHSIDPSISNQIQFDSSGRLTAGSLALLQSKNFNITEHTHLIPGSGSDPLSLGPEWSKIKSIHFNDNQPHAPNKHILDELRLLWSGKPKLGPDGNYHFSVKEMFNPNKSHSILPSGVKMPTNPTDLKFGMQMKSGGTNYWKFFNVDSNGDVALPPEFFDPNRVGVVPSGGKILPGLKTDAMAVMFTDHKGTEQVLASVVGDGGFKPSMKSINFSGIFNKTDTIPGVEELTASAIKENVTQFGVAAPIFAGAPMKHLEYDGSVTPAPSKSTPPDDTILPDSPDDDTPPPDSPDDDTPPPDSPDDEPAPPIT